MGCLIAGLATGLTGGFAELAAGLGALLGKGSAEVAGVGFFGFRIESQCQNRRMKLKKTADNLIATTVPRYHRGNDEAADRQTRAHQQLRVQGNLRCRQAHQILTLCWFRA